mgnify:CR=1 FL=1|tara:strand:- start:6 stop:497 length:492 start_codon:yes stop_codon:yes gene_type:complete
MTNCGTCSHGDNYFSFGFVRGKQPLSRKPMAPVNEGARFINTRSGYKKIIVYRDSKGRYYKSLNRKIRIPKGTRLSRHPKITGARREMKSSPKKSKRLNYKKNIPARHRLSARDVYNTRGRKAVGKNFLILQPDGHYKKKILKLDINGRPYFSNLGNKMNFGG